MMFPVPPYKHPRIPRLLHRTVLLMILLCPAVFAAENLQFIVPTDAQIYQELSVLAVAEGRHLPSGTGPWSVGELLIYLEDLKDGASSDLAGDIAAVERQLRDLAYLPDDTGFLFDLSLELNTETYIHSNEHEAFNEDEEWVVDYTERLPLANLPLEFWAGEHFYGYMEFTARNNRFYAGTGSTEPFFSDIFSTNLIIDNGLKQADASFPWRAFLSAGGDDWNLQFGRDRLDWGFGETGNLLLSDHLDYHEFIRLSLFSERSKYSMLVAAFDPAGWTGSMDPLPTHQYLIAHGLEYSPHPSLLLGVVESFMFKGEVFDFRFLNPLMFYHNFYIPGNSNSLVTFDIDYTPIKGFSLYSQFAIDEIAAPGETGGEEGGHPRALGLIAGLKHAVVTDSITSMTSLEFAYTDPYLYLRNHLGEGDAAINFIVGHRQFVRDISDMLVDRDFLGYEYGCDAIVADLSTVITHVPTKSIVSGELFYMAHGTHDMDTIWDTDVEAALASTPTSSDESGENPEKDAVEHTVCITGGLEVPINEYLSAAVSCSGIGIWNYDNIAREGAVYDLQVSLGGSLRL